MIAVHQNLEDSGIFTGFDGSLASSPISPLASAVMRAPEPNEVMILFVSQTEKNERLIYEQKDTIRGNRLIEHFKIREQYLLNPAFVERAGEKLGQLYAQGSCPIFIILHKEPLVQPICQILSDMQRTPKLFARITVVLSDALLEHPEFQGWVKQDPQVRHERINRLSQYR